MDSSELEAARAAAFRFIGYAARSSCEVERRLTRGGVSAEAMEQVLADLKQAGLIDDRQFASDWIDDRADRMRYGKKRLTAELMRRGIDGDTIKEAVSGISEEDEVRRAADLVHKKWPLTASGTIETRLTGSPAI
jgi:regulatory protein